MSRRSHTEARPRRWRGHSIPQVHLRRVGRRVRRRLRRLAAAYEAQPQQQQGGEGAAGPHRFFRRPTASSAWRCFQREAQQSEVLQRALVQRYTQLVVMKRTNKRSTSACRHLQLCCSTQRNATASPARLAKAGDTLGLNECAMQPSEYRSVRYWSIEINGTRTRGRKRFFL